MKKHYNEVMVSLQTKLSNGPLEGINNKIKVIKRTAYEFRNFNNFFSRILLAVHNVKIEIKKAAPPYDEVA